jgi:hypothetical protein
MANWRARRLAAWLGVAAALSLLVLPGALLAFPVSPGAGGSPGPAPTVAARALWNGQDVRAYGTPASALAIDFSHVIDMRFFWNASGAAGAPASVTVGTGRLQMFYFGFALSTRDVVVTNPQPAAAGTLDMSWDPGVLRWVISGTYLLTASLLDPNGTTLWSENFYVRAAAPYAVLAVIPVLLFVLAAYELYSLAVAGRYEPRPRPPTSAPAPSPPPTPPATPPAGGGS